MLTLYGVPASQASRCMWALQELGVNYQLELVRPYEETNTPELKALNPNGKIPVLVDGDLTLWESLAINLYLAQRYGSPLWPASELHRAHVLQWSFWVITEVEPFLWEMWQHRERLKESERDAARADQAESILHAALETFENHLASREWVVGQKFSVADLNVESYIIRARHGGYDLAQHSNIDRWIERCEARQARKQVRTQIEAYTSSQQQKV
ncbi:MAG: glutathione S-transferase family protein [Proteobacteria bacterium]|nr:glutathione S-transferase family protein [Pseudomonadota bacterium]